jgi:bisphosphoglycerate-independent phosphoglycerate mutase (AlkP superfamily)
MSERPFLILIVLDGFGCRKEGEFNAIAAAQKERFDALFRGAAWTTLEASGLSVGLPEGQMGNSEVGHLNIGAGRIVDQDIVRISKSASSGEMAKIPALVDTLQQVKREGRALHLVGLLSDGGVHSLQQHLHGLIDAAIANGIDLRDGEPSIFVHAILDGRDTPPRSAETYLSQLLEFLADRPAARLSTVIGRYFTMDRDHRWERVQRGYDLMTLGVGTQSKDPIKTLQRFYELGKTDEFVEPISVVDGNGKHHGKIEDGDAVIFFNGGSDTKFEGEERILVPSPKVATYDLKPDMSVFEVTDKVVEAIDSKAFDVIIMNIANPDMVGHTGVMDAAVEAVHATDVAVDRILTAVERVDGVALITADHGNCELMFDPETNQPHTAHTTNPVPFILFDAKKRFGTLRNGGALENVAPTILDILDIDQPAEMTAASLLEREGNA